VKFILRVKNLNIFWAYLTIVFTSEKKSSVEVTGIREIRLAFLTQYLHKILWFLEDRWYCSNIQSVVQPAIAFHLVDLRSLSSA